MDAAEQRDMGPEAKPLHVQVAEALGYGDCAPCSGEDGAWHFAPGSGTAYRDDFTPIWRDSFDYGEWHRCDHDRNFVPRFDTDWSATGRLIEKYRIKLSPTSDGCWWAGELDRPYQELQPKSLVAICRFILALAQAGKLKAA